ncbi:MAG: hypothetical protein ABIJ96_12005 [Elusimicrobiota bacterium]
MTARDSATQPEGPEKRSGCGCLTTILLVSAGLILAALFNPFAPSEIHPAKRARARNSGNLGAIRSALSQYNENHNGEYPRQIEQLIQENLLNSLPSAETLDHGRHSEVVVYGGEVCPTSENSGKLQDTGGWGYIWVPGSLCHGEFFVDCTHRVALDGYPWWYRPGYKYSDKLWSSW